MICRMPGVSATDATIRDRDSQVHFYASGRSAQKPFLSRIWFRSIHVQRKLPSLYILVFAGIVRLGLAHIPYLTFPSSPLILLARSSCPLAPELNVRSYTILWRSSKAQNRKTRLAASVNPPAFINTQILFQFGGDGELRRFFCDCDE
ncbi:hypothetical protein GYMLUDRAFT_761708 [Collybiopsis luxurians FD-317 M1]|uniref:Uncharacterized protein n=1 Tax=Collybiopsis luxurians FD-317 M1 TaxID=944289 RepID=A0A0D0C3Y9_9AGAR|nr:hypothetical protein GYMLUDRAFT_761708 [Collybiopsis luxurians FD-317 M1]